MTNRVQSGAQNKLQLAGQVVLGLVGVVLILAGVLKLLNVGAEDMLEGLEKARLAQHTTLISCTAIVCGVLLLLPRIQWFACLMASSYWGGAIVAHLTYDDSVLMPASFLAFLWLGVGMFWWGGKRRESPSLESRDFRG